MPKYVAEFKFEANTLDDADNIASAMADYPDIYVVGVRQIEDEVP